MKVFTVVVLGTLFVGPVLRGDDVAVEARQLEMKGEASDARLLLQRAVRNDPRNSELLIAYAEFLDRYDDPEARQAYERVLATLASPAEREKRAAVARRLVLLALTAGDRAASAKYLQEYRAAGGSDWELPTPDPVNSGSAARHTIEVPGPLRSFARMAAVSQDVTAENLLPALARNVVTNGYQASSSSEALDQTEYLKLLIRYLSQARELEKLAGSEKTIRVEACESNQTGELLRILGYRMRGGCGSEVVLETVNATRAFLTIDSGFPLAELEQDLRTNRPFVYDYKPTEAAILYAADYWLTEKDKKQPGEFIDAFLSDPTLCRLYLGMSKLDHETAEGLREAVALQRLKAFAHVLDFFGSMFEIRGGKAVVPGGARTARAWEELAGVSPNQGAAFFERLISKDDGWMASYFDALARIHGPVKDYLTEPARMKRFYMAIRGRVTSPGPARPVFRSNTDMVLLTTRLRLDPDGRPHIPGSLEVWKNLFIKHPHGKYDSKLTKLAAAWKEPDDVVEALFALCRKSVDNEPLKIFMAMSDLDRDRAQPLEAATVDRLAREYRTAGAQYTILAEVPALADKTIIQYLDTMDAVDHIGNNARRADTAGTMQALVGLWQIFCRQGSIPAAEADATLAAILSKFERFRSTEALFDAGRSGVQLLLKATHTDEGARPQERFLDLLAGTSNPTNTQAHNQVVQEMARIFDAQRLISLNLLLELADHLEAVAQGERPNTALLNRFASGVAEIQLPRASLTSVEKNSFAFGYWTEKHVQAERKLNLRAVIERGGGPEKLQEARGLLAPFLRDTLVGFNYVHYAPPGAQMLYTNPGFVRSHDFLGMQSSPQTWRSTDVYGTGWPSSAGGRLVGSLAGLPYALAEAEQNFLIPLREQALIWGDLVPQMILSAKIPRWWNVTPAQMHWVGLHMRYAESLLAAAVVNPEERKQVLEILSGQATPARVENIAQSLERGDVRAALELVTPAESFVLSREMVRQHPDSPSPLSKEILRLAAESPRRINYDAISRAFGTPKPTLTNSYQPQLLYLRTFPTLMGYSSRILAESWESNILYWAALADEVHYSPEQLNVLIPEWTQKTVERIFATHLEDWPAVLRSLRLIGDDVRMKARQQVASDQKASLN